MSICLVRTFAIDVIMCDTSSQGDIGGPRAPPSGFEGTIMVELTNLSTLGNCMLTRKKSGL